MGGGGECCDRRGSSYMYAQLISQITLATCAYQGVYLMPARSPEASAYHLGLVQSFPTLARWASGSMLQYIITYSFIFLHVYIQYIVLHTYSTQLAYCANLMVMLSCIAIMKLLHQSIAVETLYLICATYAVSKTIASPYAQLFTVPMISNSIVCPIVKCILNAKKL